MAYKIFLPQFEGPLDLLLQLIEEEKLDITQISLAKVADAFLGYLEKIEQAKPEELADFLVVAAKLLFIKSITLLPGAVMVDQESTELIDQLKIYREYLLASKILQKMINQGRFAYARKKLPANLVQKSFRLTSNITPKTLKNSFENILHVILSQIKLTQGRIRKGISLKEKMAELINLFKKKGEVNLSSLVQKLSKEEIVVTFLATLELVKEQNIIVCQNELFSEIIIRCPELHNLN